MMRRLPTIGWIVVVWLIASGSFTVAAAVGGVAAGLVLTALFRPERASSGATTVRPVATVHFLGYFLVKLARANAQVALAVIDPSRVKHRRGIVAVPVAPCSETIVWFLANVVSLTPGTSIVELRRDPYVFYVHVLLLTSVTDVRRDVLEVQRRLLAAFGPPSALRDVDGRLARLATVPPTPQEPPP